MSRSLTTEEFVRRAKLKHGDLYDYTKTTYTSSLEKVTIVCKEHGAFPQTANQHINGRGCPTCAKEASKKDQTWTTEKFVSKAKEVHGNLYDYTKTAYVFSKTKLVITCKEHGDFLQLPTLHLAGQGCQTCGRIKGAKKEKIYTEEDKTKFISECIERFEDRYDLTEVVYEGYKSQISVTCNLHGHSFVVNAMAFLNRGSGCRSCTDIRAKIEEDRSSNKQDLTQVFIQKAINVHGETYSYENVKYVNCETKVSITCSQHGDFETTPTQHISRKTNCPKCGIHKSSTTRMYSIEQFVDLARKKHGSLYDYSAASYNGYNCQLTIICHQHGSFQQTPQDHLRSSGCPSCGKTVAYTTETFVARAKEIHGDRYDYSRVEYTSAHNTIQIICRKHGVFEQVAFNHLQGNNCRLCWQESNCSKAQIDWLEYISNRDGIHIQHAMNGGEFKIPNSRYFADGYCRESNMIYEFNGKLYHGDPEVYKCSEYIPYLKSTAGELYDKTMKKEAFIRDQGFELVTMWETEWIRICRKVKTIQRAFRAWLIKRHRSSR